MGKDVSGKRDHLFHGLSRRLARTEFVLSMPGILQGTSQISMYSISFLKVCLIIYFERGKEESGEGPREMGETQGVPSIVGAEPNAGLDLANSEIVT